MNTKKLKDTLDFDLASDFQNTKETKVDFLLDKKQNNKNQNETNNDDPYYLFSNKTKSKKLQTYITDEVHREIQMFKLKHNIKKDTDAIEYLLRKSLGLKQK